MTPFKIKRCVSATKSAPRDTTPHRLLDRKTTDLVRRSLWEQAGVGAVAWPLPNPEHLITRWQGHRALRKCIEKTEKRLGMDARTTTEHPRHRERGGGEFDVPTSTERPHENHKTIHPKCLVAIDFFNLFEAREGECFGPRF